MIKSRNHIHDNYPFIVIRVYIRGVGKDTRHFVSRHGDIVSLSRIDARVDLRVHVASGVQENLPRWSTFFKATASLLAT